MANLRHISIENTATAHPYTSPQLGRTKEFDRPPCDRNLHAQKLQGQLQEAVREATVQHNGVTPDEYPITLEFRSEKEFLLLADSLQDKRSKIRSFLGNFSALSARGARLRLSSQAIGGFHGLFAFTASELYHVLA